MGGIGETSNGGISRLTLSQSDKEARDLLVSWMKELKLNIRVDDIGNIYGRREGRNNNEKPIVIGSHLDSIIDGGKFDGILGIACGIELVKTLNENEIVTNRPIEIVNFTDEEGVRFNSMMAGSGILSGDYEINEIYKKADTNQVSFLNELKKIGYLGAEENRLKEAAAFLEVHIEQGPILYEENIPIGIVDGIIGFSWLEVTVKGKEANSGPTPMIYRKDALKTSAKMISTIHSITSQISNQAMTTIGEIKVEPGNVNTIPGIATFTVDIRAETIKKQNDGVKLIKNTLEEIARDEGLEINIKELESMNPIQFDSDLTDILVDSTNELNYQYKKIVSGAGHISTFMNKVCPTAMIFVPSIGGDSHSPKEKTDWKDIEKAANLLLKAVMEIDKKASTLKVSTF